MYTVHGNNNVYMFIVYAFRKSVFHQIPNTYNMGLQNPHDEFGNVNYHMYLILYNII
jgi:hypothetical protein